MARNAPARKTGSRAGRSVLAISLAVLVLFVTASLVFWFAGQQSGETSYCGPLGHWIAAGLVVAFGFASVFVPVLAGLGAWLLLSRGRGSRPIAGLALWVLAAFTALGLLEYQAALHPYPALTGAAGAFVGWGLTALLGFGAWVLIAVLLIWGLNVRLRARLRDDLLETLFVLLLGLLIDLFLAYFFQPLRLGGLSGDYSPGGIAGIALVGLLTGLVGKAGTLFVITGCTLIVIAVFTTVRVPELGWLRRVFERLFAWLRNSFRRRPTRTEPVEPGEEREPVPVRSDPGPPRPVEPEPVQEEPRPVPPPRRVPPPRFNLTEFQKEFLGHLDQPTEGDRAFKDPGEAEQEKEILLDKLAQFKIVGRVSDILSGPMITRFEFEPAPGIKVSSVENLADDLSLALSAERIRILAPIPGKNAVGIEIPNKVRQTVFLRDVLTSEGFRKERSPLGFALGTTITGEPYSSDLRTMPHILIAGTTGSGKSVCINSIIASIIYRSSWRDVRFLTIDPKQLELPLYNPIPHLLGRTTTDPGQAVNQLTRIVNIMDARIGEFAKLGVRDIAGYNARAEEEGFERKPYIVVVIDELADLMLRAENEIEQRITRLAQMSRAVGIHLIIATQRPSVDVITGLIKANFPCRIAFQVASKTDSRTILDLNGAEALLGRGDMLFLPPGKGEPVRLHGTFVSDRAAKRIVDLWARTYLAELLAGLVDNPAERAAQLVAADAVDAFFDPEKSGIKKKQDQMRAVLPEDAIDSLMGRQYYSTLSEESPEVMAERTRVQQQQTLEFDEKFAEAARIVVRHREASVSMLQRRLDVGWARAGRIIDQLEQAGIVGPYVGSKSRKVLVSGEAELDRVLADMTKA